MKIPAIKPVTAAISGSLIEDQINAAKRIKENPKVDLNILTGEYLDSTKNS